MKLQELAVVSPTKQAAKVFESYFGDKLAFESLSGAQARSMLERVRALISEHRRTPDFHNSEHNPAYLKLVVMEQALAATAAAPAATAAKPTGAPTPAAMALQRQQQERQVNDAIKAKQKEITDKQKELMDLQKQKGQMEGRRSLKQRLREASEVQQAQVVLASQDMVDQVQKMSEQVSAMQFKDLPALVDSIKNEVGVDQAMQFNTDATAALAGLLQNLQGAKTQLEAALGVVTGQAPTIPGDDMAPGQGLGAEMPAELPMPGEEVDTTELDIEEPEAEPAASALGRGRR